VLGKKACISTSVVRVVCEIYRNEVEEGLKKPAKRLTSDEKLTALLEVYVDTLYSEVCQKYEIRYRCVLSYWIAKYHKGGTFEDWRSVRHTRNIPVHKKDVAPIEKEKTKYLWTELHMMSKFHNRHMLSMRQRITHSICCNYKVMRSASEGSEMTDCVISDLPLLYVITAWTARNAQVYF